MILFTFLILFHTSTASHVSLIISHCFSYTPSLLLISFLSFSTYFNVSNTLYIFLYLFVQVYITFCILSLFVYFLLSFFCFYPLLTLYLIYSFFFLSPTPSHFLLTYFLIESTYNRGCECKHLRGCILVYVSASVCAPTREYLVLSLRIFAQMS